MKPTQYFASSPGAPSAPRTVDVLLPDVTFTLTSDTGVFSYGSLDDATRILLESAPAPPPVGDLLDLGCGYGPIALTLAKRSPEATVWAVDVNERARSLTEVNAAALGLTNVRVATPDDVPSDVLFAAVYSNPPIRVGKTALHGLLSTWLGRLATDGSAYLVVGRHLGADSLGTWMSGQGYVVERLTSRRSYRVLTVGARR